MNRIIFFFIPALFWVACAPDEVPIADLEPEQYNRPIWPEPKAHEVEVMVLGVFHMSNPGLDAHNLEADDVCSAKRQAELASLCEHLADFNPDMIMTEWSYSSQHKVDSLYTQVSLDTLLRSNRDESIQIGFRLAKKLGHERVFAIDYRMMLGNDSLNAYQERHPTAVDPKISFPDLDWKHLNHEDDSLLRVTTIESFLWRLNQEEVHQRNHYGMFQYLMEGEQDNYGGPVLLAQWYERNFRMVHNIYRAAKPETKRILLIVGAGHVSPLRHILDDAPMFCPVSPIPYLHANGISLGQRGNK